MSNEGIQLPNTEDIAFGKEELKIPQPEIIETEISAEKIIENLARVQNLKDQLALALLIKAEKPACVFNPQVQGVRQIVAMLNLPSQIRLPDRSILVGRDPAALEQLLEAEDLPDTPEMKDNHAKAMGRALGYPETAVQGWGDETFNWYTDLPEEIRASGILEVSNFGFSKDHWREELALLIKQVESVKDIAPQVYNRIRWENLTEFE